MKHVLAIVSDLHCGSTLGLMPADGIQLDDGGHYLPSSAQAKLWKCWEDYWTIVADRAKGSPLIVVVNGDALDGDHHRTAQIVSKNLAATQLRIAELTLQPALSLSPAAVHLVRGTEAHVGASAEYEERLAEAIGCPRCPSTGAYSRWHLQCDVEGVLLDFAHHGRLGQRPWTKMTGPATLAAQILQASAKHKSRCPDLAVRSHYHQEADTFDNYPVRVVQTRGWQLSTAFVHRIAAGSLPEIGGLIVTCEDGAYTVEKIRFDWKREEPWTPSA